jgi:predicted acylesterase/phospholipase RssA
MSRLVLLVIIPFLMCIAGANNTPVYIRLIFNDTLTNQKEVMKYLWERRVIDGNRPWAQESIPGDEWKNIDGLPRKIKIGLALAGGGDRGIAHIGVLRALEEHNIPIHAIAGTSMGSIVGGLYVCGYSIDTLEYMIMKDIKWREIFSDQPPRNLAPIWERLRDKPREPGLEFDIKWRFWPPTELKPIVKYKPGAGLRTAQNFTNVIAERTLMYDYYAGFDFDSLPIPYSVMLVNMATKKSELKRHGTISTAARASGSMPVVFEPMKINGYPYVDGGVLDNLPVDAFIDFDSTRAPKNRMFVNVKDSVPYDYIIAVHPIKRKNARDVIEEEPSLAGPFGIGVVNSIMTIARDVHDWNSWDNADGKIDIDVQGNFDFTYGPLKDKIRKGYDAGTLEVYAIKYQIAYLEGVLNKASDIDPIVRIAKLEVFLNGLRVYPEKDNVDIFRAIRFKEGSYIQKIDVCDALKRLYAYGNYNYIEAKLRPYVNDGLDFCDLVFTITEQDAVRYLEVVKEALHVSFEDLIVDYEVSKAIGQRIKKYIEEQSHIPSFAETKFIIEMCMVEYGYIQPRIDSIQYNNYRLAIFGRVADRIKGIIVNCGDRNETRDLNTKRVLEEHFNGENAVFGYKQSLQKSSDLYKQFFLKTIAIEDIQDDSLIVACEKKASHTLEFPALSLERVEGLNLFTEARIREWFGWSIYVNYSQNFPLKMAYEIPRGQKISFGFQRCNSNYPFNLKFIPRPDFYFHWQTIKYSAITDSLNYDHQYQEVIGHGSFPFYTGHIGFLPGVESVNFDSTMQTVPGEWIWWTRWHYDLKLRWDNLDRLIFPENGMKVDFEAKANMWDLDWWRMRLKFMGAVSWTIQNVVLIFTPIFTGSYFSPETPLYEQYTIGGYTPPGSYQLRLYDYDDLPGHRRDLFQEPYMWKAGCTARLTLFRMSPLDMQFNIHLIGYYYAANAHTDLTGDNILDILGDDIKDSPGFGLYFDSNFLNLGVMYEGKKDGFWNKFHYSLVFYGIGF